MRSISSNAESLLDFHEGLDAELQAAHGRPCDGLLQALMDAFVQRIPFFKLYASYCSNYVHAAHKLSCLRKLEPAVASKIAAIEAEYGTTLLALLIRPVQRICQYPLLFGEVRRQERGQDIHSTVQRRHRHGLL